MKRSFGALLFAALVLVAFPAVSAAQVRVYADVGARHYRPPVRYVVRHPTVYCGNHVRYGCYPARTVIVRQAPVHRQRVVVVVPRHHRVYRHR